MPDPVEGFPPLPAGTEPPDALEELRLQDALANPPLLASEGRRPYPLGRAPAYDFEAHRFVPGVAGGPLMTRGTATLATWVQKCLSTRRGENPAVDPNFGLDITAEDLLGEGEPFDESAIAEYLTALKRALLVHPRITAVDEARVDTDPDDDRVFVSFLVITDSDEVPDLAFERLPIGA